MTAPVALARINTAYPPVRFILDGKLATMYSSGSPEGGSDSSDNRSEFLEKLQRARASVRPHAPPQPVLSQPSSARLVVGNWSLSCRRDGELVINNNDGQQVRADGRTVVPNSRTVCQIILIIVLTFNR